MNGGTATRPAFDRAHRFYLVPSSCQLKPWNSPATPGSATVPACAIPLVNADQSFTSELAVGAADTLSTSITIPIDTTPGVYRLMAYADYLRQVSEKNEFNNWAVSASFTITPPQYVLIGPLTPCSATSNPNCTKGTGSTLPVAFQFSYDGVTAVDSSATPPRLKIYAAGSSTPLFIASPDDVASGGSGWQYFGASCIPVGTTACARPAYTYQYNWQLKVPGSNTNLPPGNYVLKIEVPATKRVAPASCTLRMFSRPIPPSTWIGMPGPMTFRSCLTFSGERSMNA